MNPLMHNPAFRSKQVFGPCLLNMYQSALPLTKKQVLEAREGEKVVFGVHHALFLYFVFQRYALRYLIPVYFNIVV